jgi:hypothetical protein
VERGNDDGKETGHDDQEENEPERAPALRRGALPLRRRLVGAGDDLVDGVEPGPDAVGDPALAETRRDDLAQDLARERVGELGLETVADLETTFLSSEDQEACHRYGPFSPPPGLGEANGKSPGLPSSERKRDTIWLLLSRSRVRSLSSGGRAHRRKAPRRSR